MKHLRLVESGSVRHELERKALSAILRRDAEAFNALMAKMAPQPPAVSVVATDTAPKRSDSSAPTE